ncbi:hypothetical protein PPERSA_04051 [Pseudocohnilembus persalinus]|uniref:Uncharacterized protein n=1 Tax=Pseudocohnilembus persalinus TaxID=266149 RepID=A0A0V0QLH9_PSEPJ|nr:hypothetical protein PPERSA_04051 [Pseudocohnilembus persalinus]|eukprot:KRX02848.1 hypothetical protein PPERSA_04051 [Pseudocohnilembus persalinus]
MDDGIYQLLSKVSKINFKSKKYLYKELVVQSVIDFTKEKQQLCQKIEELNEKQKILGQNLDREQNKNHAHQIKYENSEMEFQKKYENERLNLQQRLQQSEKEKLLKTAEAEAYEKQIEQLEKQFIIFQEKQSKEIEKKNNQFNQEKMKVEQLMKETDFKHENFKENVQDIFEKYKTAICTLKLNKEKIQNLEIQIQQLQTENNRLSIRASTNFEDLTPRPNLQNFTEFINQVQTEKGEQNGLFNSQDQINSKNLQNKSKYVDFKSLSTRENISNLELKTKELFNNLKCEISNQQKIIQQQQSQNGQPISRINLQGKKKKTIIQNSKKSQQDYDSANDIINNVQKQNNFEQNQINQDDIIIENEEANTINQRKQIPKTSLDIKNFNQNINIQDQKNSKTNSINIQDNV